MSTFKRELLIFLMGVSMFLMAGAANAFTEYKKDERAFYIAGQTGVLSYMTLKKNIEKYGDDMGSTSSSGTIFWLAMVARST